MFVFHLIHEKEHLNITIFFVIFELVDMILIVIHTKNTNSIKNG